MQSNFPGDDYQAFIYYSRYSRWVDEEGRREHWPETINRYLDFFEQRFPEQVRPVRSELYDVIYNLQVMPSMRALMTAGPALERCNVAGYNCAYSQIKDLKKLDELFYILMCGTGVGYSVESEYVSKLPPVSGTMSVVPLTIRVGDSKAGWCSAFRALLFNLYQGQIPKWDTSDVRPAGARLKTFGGRASGPGPLEELFEFTVRLIRDASGRRLTTLEVHDLCCKIAEIVVVGGVRRSAMISLSDLNDREMAHCKSGNWWEQHPHRSLANNSAVYNGRPSADTFFEEWHSLFNSKSGERGIFNRASAKEKTGIDEDFGVNPCGEILLRPDQFCNLTEAVIRSGDSQQELRSKVEYATILGTLQATLTDFKYLRKVWKDTTEKDRLLGVSLTGLYDTNFYTYDYPDLWLSSFLTNEEWAYKLGITPARDITCVKPSGTVSQLVNSSSGMHPRHSGHYIRTVRADNKDPITKFMADQGVPNEPCQYNPGNTTVFSFPIQSPRQAVIRENLSALGHLKDWLHIRTTWCDHNPSITVSIKDDEWFAVADFVYTNFDQMCGLSFLPYDGGSYKQAPYQEINASTYKEVASKMPVNIQWELLSQYEDGTDRTAGSSTMACSGDVCEVVDLV